MYMSCVYANDWPGVAELMLLRGEAGKDGSRFSHLSRHTIHQAFGLVEPPLAAPLAAHCPEVAAEAPRSHYKRLVWLGTRYLMEGPVYPEKLKASGVGTSHSRPANKRESNQPDYYERTGELRSSRADSLAYFRM